jgi:hypothetical protein
VDCGQDLEVPIVFVRMCRVLRTDHLFVDLLAGSHPDDPVRGTGRDRARNVDQVHGRDLLYIDLASLHITQSMPDELDGLFQCNHEARHAWIRDRQNARMRKRHEERNDRAPRAHDIPIPYDGETRPVGSCVGITCNEQLVRGELRRTVEIYRIAGFVG